MELGKTDEEMETDPTLSLENLMRFDPDAEDGEFDLVMQVRSQTHNGTIVTARRWWAYRAQFSSSNSRVLPRDLCRCLEHS